MSEMADRRVNLPGMYELITIVPGGQVLRDAIRRAEEGADEGTLVWSPPPITSGGSSIWPGALECALILRPEYPLAVAVQLVYVGALSMAAAMIEQVLPMTRVRLRWPNAVLLNDCEGAIITPHWASADDGSLAWMVLGLKADMAADRRGYEMPAYEEDRNYSVFDLLEQFSRHFLSQINRWAEQGFGPTRKAWLQRADGIDEALEIEIGPERVRGSFKTVDEQGELILKLADGKRRRVSIIDAFSAPH